MIGSAGARKLRGESHFTELWGLPARAEPQGRRLVSVGVENHQQQTAFYRVLAVQDGDRLLSRHIELPNGGDWEAHLRVKGISNSDPVVVTLLRGGDGAIRNLGGFDRALGTGTLAQGGEDLDICIRLLHSGRKLTYEPAAMVWHRHPDTFAAVRRQVFGYGVGLGAMLAKHVVVGPNRWTVVSLSAQGISYYTDPESRKNALRGPSFPRSLVRLERTGLLLGPLAYLASRSRQGR